MTVMYAMQSPCDEKLKSILRDMKEGYYEVDVGGTFTFVNDELCKMLGFTPDELLGSDSSRVMDDANAESVRATVSSIYRTGAPACGFGWEIIRKDGERRTVEASISVIRDEAGITIGTGGVVRDVTDRKRVLEKLRESEERLRTAQSMASLGFIDWNLVTDNMYWSDETYCIFGIDPEEHEATYAATANLVHPEDRDFVLKQIAAALTDKRTYEIDYRVVRPSGDVRYVRARGDVKCNEHGIPVRMVGTVLDITGLRRVEKQQVLLTAAMEQAVESVVITDIGGTIVYVNPAAEATTGYSAAELVGQNPRMVKSGKHDRKFYQQFWETILGGGVWEGHITNRRKDGTLYEEDASITPVRDGKGKITHFVAVKRDVTHEVELANQLRQSQKMEAVGQLTGGIAHDFNNLLTVIRGNADLIAHSLPEGDGELLSSLRDLQTSAQRGTELVSKLLGFSRRQTIELKPIDLRIVVSEMSDMLRRALPARIDVRLCMEESAGAVNADAAAVEQIVLNLANNARDAMPQSGILRIEVRRAWLDDEYRSTHGWGEPGEYVCLSVSDTGTGMDEATKKKIFEPFFTTKEPGIGTGLGMAMIYGLVKQHEGFVDVYSELGQGTTIKIFFPIVEGQVGEESVLTHLPRSAPELRGGTETILVVDDQPELLRSATRILEKFGYTVLTAGDGEDALALLRTHGSVVELVMSDLIMPKLGGRELFDTLKREGRNLKFLFTSGYTARDVRESAALDAGLPFLSKPWTLTELVVRVRELLDQTSVS